MIHTLPTSGQKPKIIFHPHPVMDNSQIRGIEGNITRVISDLPCRIILTKQILCDEPISLQSNPRGIYITKLIIPPTESNTQTGKEIKSEKIIFLKLNHYLYSRMEGLTFQYPKYGHKLTSQSHYTEPPY